MTANLLDAVPKARKTARIRREEKCRRGGLGTPDRGTPPTVLSLMASSPSSYPNPNSACCSVQHYALLLCCIGPQSSQCSCLCCNFCPLFARSGPPRQRQSIIECLITLKFCYCFSIAPRAYISQRFRMHLVLALYSFTAKISPRRFLNRWLQAVTPATGLLPACGVIAPHAGYSYSVNVRSHGCTITRCGDYKIFRRDAQNSMRAVTRILGRVFASTCTLGATTVHGYI